MTFFLSLLLLLCSFPAVASESENFACEIMTLQGVVERVSLEGTRSPLKEGDTVRKGDLIEVGSGASADISYDKDWTNVIRLEEKTKVKVGTVSPAKLSLREGGVFAKLKKLPANSSFEVQTPTAIAAVRGTEYRTTVLGGQTEVFSFSESIVQVYGVDASGARLGEPVALYQSQKTSVSAAGEKPEPPSSMSLEEAESGESIKNSLEEEVQQVVASGRTGKIQSLSSLEAKKVSSETEKPTEESRVTDSRRRQFRAN